MKIATRLMFGLGALSALLTVVALFAVIEGARIDRSVGRMAAVGLTAAEASAAIDKNVQASVPAIRGYLMTGEEQFRQERAQSWSAIETGAARLDKFGGGEKWDETRRHLAALKAIQDRAESAGPGGEAINTVLSEGQPHVQRLIALLEGEVAANGQRAGGMVEELGRMLDQDAKAAKSDAVQLRIVSLLCLLAGLAGAFFVTLSTRKSIVPPLVSITAVMGELAAGNLEVEVPGRERGDEIGAMAAALELFREKLQRQRVLEARQRAEDEKLIARTRKVADLTSHFDNGAAQAVETLAAAARKLHGTAEVLSSTAEESGRQAVAVAAASGQVTSNMRVAASAADRLAGSIGEISKRAAASTEISRNAAVEARKAESVVETLSSAVLQIGDVVSLINDIAAQTNLLALNATIEAARAGEAGKGFSVVAGEVKQLANQTARATDDISKQIGVIQTQTQRAVSTIRGIVRTIEEVGDISGGISDSVAQQSNETRNIAGHVEHAAEGTAEVSGNAGGLKAAATRTGATSHELLDASLELAEQSDALRDLVKEFLGEMRGV